MGDLEVIPKIPILQRPLSIRFLSARFLPCHSHPIHFPQPHFQLTLPQPILPLPNPCFPPRKPNMETAYMRKNALSFEWTILSRTRGHLTYIELVELTLRPLDSRGRSTR